MKKTIFKAFVLLFVLVTTNLFSQTSKYIRKAEAATYRGIYTKAKNYYAKALEKEPENYKANLGMGILLADYLMSYENSLPYLEKALKAVPIEEASPSLLFSLGKVYAYSGQFNNALTYFDRVSKIESLKEDGYFQMDLEKRISDCKYAKKKLEIESVKKLYVVNAGSSINSEVDEYVPVLTPTSNQLIFTSKRKDGLKEKINPDNGKYFEAMYISDIKNGYTSDAKLFSVTTKKSLNKDESVVSIFPDGQKIFIYKDKKLYEGNIDRSAKNANKSSDVINFDDYQNHACLTKDGKTLYFTSESESGVGGNDIYVSEKDADGNWGTPKNLGKIINTIRDEEAPFISADGLTLYFASNGQSECYGEFDIYKSKFENGRWGLPINLGLPINSTANDIFYVSSDDEATAYFSSARSGGKGDLDIYKVVFPDKYSTDCNQNVIAIQSKENPEDSYKYNFNVPIPENMKESIISFAFNVGDSLVSDKNENLNYHFSAAGNFKVNAKLIAACDTCIVPYIACGSIDITIKDTTPIVPVVAANNSVENGGGKNTDVALNTNKGKNNKEAGDKGANNSVENGGGNNTDVALNKNKGKNNKKGGDKGVNNDNSSVVSNKPKVETPVEGELTDSELKEIGLNFKPVYFEFDDEQLTKDAQENLNYNLAILQKYPDLKIYLNGHTDSKGGTRYNLYLSERRAITVKKYLNEAGIPKRNMRTVAKGEEFLLNNCDNNTECDEAQHQINRRVVIKVVKRWVY